MTDATDSFSDGSDRNGPDTAAVEPDQAIDPFDLPCEELVELITDYLEGALDPTLEARVEAHLSVCPPCVWVIEQFRQVAGAVGAIVEDDLDAVDPSVRAELMAAFRIARRSG